MGVGIHITDRPTLAPALEVGKTQRTVKVGIFESNGVIRAGVSNATHGLNTLGVRAFQVEPVKEFVQVLDLGWVF
jgi:hypothetical protein